MMKKTAFHTGLTIRQVKSILKKTEALERQRANQTDIPPDMIMISYSAEKGYFIVFEDFCSGTGKKRKFDHRKESEISSLQSYIFPANFYGQVLLDLMELPDETGNLFSFNAGMLRAETGLLRKEFSLEFEGNENPTSNFNIICYESTN